MDKQLLTDSVAVWLDSFLKKKYGDVYKSIRVVKPERNLNLLTDTSLRGISGYNSWEFKPDVIGLLTDQYGKTDIVLVNRNTSSISLKEIGEMNCYAQLALPLLSMIISPKAASSEVNGILLDNKMQERILGYGGSSPLMVMGWDEVENHPMVDSILPIDSDKFIFGD